MASKIPFEKIRSLSVDKRWPVARIAKHLGVTRQAVYERMRREGLAYRGPHQVFIPEPLLRKLYLSDLLTIAEIARKLGHSTKTVSRELDRLRIKRKENSRLKDDLGLQTLRIGDQLEIKTGGQPPYQVYSLRKRLNIRVVVRRLSRTVFAVIRTPPLDTPTVRSLVAEGRTKKEVARLYLADPKSISKFL